MESACAGRCHGVAGGWNGIFTPLRMAQVECARLPGHAVFRRNRRPAQALLPVAGVHLPHPGTGHGCRVLGVVDHRGRRVGRWCRLDRDLLAAHGNVPLLHLPIPARLSHPHGGSLLLPVAHCGLPGGARGAVECSFRRTWALRGVAVLLVFLLPLQAWETLTSALLVRVS